MNGFKRSITLLSFLFVASCAPPHLFGGGSKNKGNKNSQKTKCDIEVADDAIKLQNFGEEYDSYIVKLDQLSLRTASLDYSLKGLKSENLKSGFIRIDLSKVKDKIERLLELSEHPAIEFIEPDYPIELESTSQKDPVQYKQWAHTNVESSKAWGISEGSKEVVVAVIDSGVDYSHADLRDNMWVNPKEVRNGRDDDGNGLVDDIYGWDFAGNDNDPRPAKGGSSHGTHVAGTVGAVGSNGIGISGHAPKVKIMALKFMGSDGGGRTSDAIKSINYAVNNGAHVLNNSWGSRNWSRSMHLAISEAERKGLLFVVAAGNSGTNNDSYPWYPASYPHKNILRVAATTASDRIASFSNYGPSVQIAAPGYKIYSTYPGNSYGLKSGTSMAAPLVSGVAATLLALEPGLSARQLIEIITDSADRFSGLKNKVSSSGRINAYKAVLKVQSMNREDLDADDGETDSPADELQPGC